MAATKTRSPLEKEQLLAKVARLTHMGFSQWEIGRRVDRSGPVVNELQKEIKRRCLEAMTDEWKEMVAEKRAEWALVRAAAWRAFYRSTKDAESVELEKGVRQIPLKGRDGKPTGKFRESFKLLKEIQTSEGRLPGNEYLKTIGWTLVEEAKLLGLVQDVTVNKNTLNVGVANGGQETAPAIDWDRLFERVPEPDVLEGKMEVLPERGAGGAEGVVTEGPVVHAVPPPPSSNGANHV